MQTDVFNNFFCWPVKFFLLYNSKSTISRITNGNKNLHFKKKLGWAMSSLQLAMLAGVIVQCSVQNIPGNTECVSIPLCMPVWLFWAGSLVEVMSLEYKVVDNILGVIWPFIQVLQKTIMKEKQFSFYQNCLTTHDSQLITMGIAGIAISCWSHVMTCFMSARTYSNNPGPNCGYESMTTCVSYNFYICTVNAGTLGKQFYIPGHRYESILLLLSCNIIIMRWKKKSAVREL